MDATWKVAYIQGWQELVRERKMEPFATQLVGVSEEGGRTCDIEEKPRDN